MDRWSNNNNLGMVPHIFGNEHLTTDDSQQQAMMQLQFPHQKQEQQQLPPMFQTPKMYIFRTC